MLGYAVGVGGGRLSGARAAMMQLLLLGTVLSAVVAMPAAAESYLDGYWAPVYDEDRDERIPGPDQGDYAGLPVTPAAVSVAQSWDPEVLTLPTLQCRPHPALYGIRGIGNLRITEVLDPYTQRQTEIRTWIWAWEAQRDIWMDEQAHPPPWAPHTWGGFSVGHWNGDVLEVHTDMLKRGWVRRNGLPTDDDATLDEHFFRYGNILTHVEVISDPEYLSEPLVKSTEYTLIPNAGMGTWPCRKVTEIPRDKGYVPMHLPNQTAVEKNWAVRNHVPIKAAMGGAETMLPEYQDYMKTLPPNPPLAEVERQEEQEARASLQ
jgi:hypothetical protein